MSSFTESLLAYGGINVLLALGLYVILSAGQLSLGNAGFMAVGAYTALWLFVKMDVGFYVSLLCGGVLAGLIGCLVGLPALRMRGLYLAVATLGFGEVVRAFFLTFKPTGGANGFRAPTSGVELWQIWLCVALAIGLLIWLGRTRTWLAVRAVHDDEFAAELVGYPTTAIKVGAFALGAFLTGIGGGLYGHYNVYVDPTLFGFLESLTIVLFVILGGSRTLIGPVFGALFVTTLPEWIRGLQDYRHAVYGLLLTTVVLFAREGVFSPRVVRALTAPITGGRRPQGRAAA